MAAVPASGVLVFAGNAFSLIPPAENTGGVAAALASHPRTPGRKITLAGRLLPVRPGTGDQRLLARPHDHPNGLSDFVLVKTMEHLRQEGYKGLALNFALMRAVVAGEAGDRLTLDSSALC